jgi:hypothetical protein
MKQLSGQQGVGSLILQTVLDRDSQQKLILLSRGQSDRVNLANVKYKDKPHGKTAPLRLKTLQRLLLLEEQLQALLQLAEPEQLRLPSLLLPRRRVALPHLHLDGSAYNSISQTLTVNYI